MDIENIINRQRRKKLIVPTPCDGTLYPLAMVTEGKLPVVDKEEKKD